MLAIGAVIGAGIFGSIGSAAAGQLGAEGERDFVRVGAGPALIISFVLLGGVCALAGALLRRARVDDSAGRQCVRVFVRDAR